MESTGTIPFTIQLLLIDCLPRKLCNFQRCYMSASTMNSLKPCKSELQENSETQINTSTFVCIPIVQSSNNRGLSFSCLVNVISSPHIDVSSSCACDFRVLELHTCTPKIDSSTTLSDMECSGGKSERDDMNLSKYIGFLEKWEDRLLSSSSVSSTSDVPGRKDVFEQLSSSVIFNDALRCTSKDMKILKSGTIKMMRLTVICHLESTAKSPWLEHATSTIDKGSHINENLLTDKIRHALQAYDVHLRKSVLIDVRKCPVSSFPRKGAPPVAYVFVNDCVMKEDNDDIGRVNNRTVVTIDKVHDLDYYFRLCNSRRNGDIWEIESVASAKSVSLQVSRSISSEFRLKLEAMRDKNYSDSSTLVGKKNPPPGILIIGPSLSGKRSLVVKTATKCQAKLFEINFASMSLHDVSNVCDVCTRAFEDSICTAQLYASVLLLVRLDCLDCSTSSQQKDNAKNPTANLNKRKIVNHLCALFDSVSKNTGFTIVATSNKPHLIPIKLRRAGRLETQVLTVVSLCYKYSFTSRA